MKTKPTKTVNCPICNADLPITLKKQVHVMKIYQSNCVALDHNYDLALDESDNIVYEMILTKKCGSHHNSFFENTEIGIYDLEKNHLVYHPNKFPGRLLYSDEWESFIQNYFLLA